VDFKRYFGKIKDKNEKPKQKPETVDETQDNIAQEQESDIDNPTASYIVWLG